MTVMDGKRVVYAAPWMVALLVLTGCSPAESESPEADEEVAVVAPVPATEATEAEETWSTMIPPSTLTSPPFDGTVYLTADALTPDSPSDLVDVTFEAAGPRETFDRRVDDWVNAPSWVYQASYSCGRPSVAVIVNQEFSREQADLEAERFAFVLGQLPSGVRTNVDELWIHRGSELAGGGNRSILIHTDYANDEWDYIEEIFLHEAAHTSLDYDFGGAVNPSSWAKAQQHDQTFISTYAEDYPTSEDIAESYGAFYVWALHREQGAFADEAALVAAAIPGRLSYFDSLGPAFGPSHAEQCR